MKRIILLVAALLLLASGASAQVSSPNRVVYRNTLPATCTPGSSAMIRLTVAPYSLNNCTATNSWSVVGAATSPGGSSGDIQYNNAGSFGGVGSTGTGNVVRSTSPAITTPTGIVKGDVGLGNVDNTSDANKPVSTAAQTALDLKAPLASPTFTGTPTLPTGTIATTQSAADSSTKLATTAFVTTADNLKANLSGGNTFNGVQIFLSSIAAGTSSNGVSLGYDEFTDIKLVNTGIIGWTNGNLGAAKDTSVKRVAAGVVAFGGGTAGSTGNFKTGGTTAQPTCDSTTRGYVWTVYGGAGVKDTQAVCLKDAADAYAWRTIY